LLRKVLTALNVIYFNNFIFYYLILILISLNLDTGHCPKTVTHFPSSETFKSLGIFQQPLELRSPKLLRVRYPYTHLKCVYFFTSALVPSTDFITSVVLYLRSYNNFLFAQHQAIVSMKRKSIFLVICATRSLQMMFVSGFTTCFWFSSL